MSIETPTLSREYAAAWEVIVCVSLCIAEILHLVLFHTGHVDWTFVDNDLYDKTSSAWHWYGIGLASLGIALLPMCFAFLRIDEDGVAFSGGYRKWRLGWAEIDSVSVVPSEVTLFSDGKKLAVHGAVRDWKSARTRLLEELLRRMPESRFDFPVSPRFLGRRTSFTELGIRNENDPRS